MKICFIYNVKHNTNYSTEGSQEDIEFDSVDVIEAIEKTIKKLGHEVIKMEADLTAFSKLQKHKADIDLVFNIAEGLSGDARESQVPIFCEMLGIPYTHSSPTTHAIKLNKHLTKTLLRSVGVQSPQSSVVSSEDQAIKHTLKYPLIVKPNKEGSSKGVFNDSVVNTDKELRKAVDRLVNQLACDEVILEEYVDGRELTVALLGNPPKVLPIIEQRFDFLPAGFNKIAGYEAKWIYEDNLKDISEAYVCPAKLSPKLQENVEKTSKIIWDTMEVKDCARIDYRVNRDELFFIEINTIPGINPDPTIISYFPTAARKAGLSFEQLITEIINSAIARYK